VADCTRDNAHEDPPCYSATTASGVMT
jgi:hypothetical protein